MFKSVRMSALFVSGFLCFVGMFKSVRLGALFFQTLSVEAHENKIQSDPHRLIEFSFLLRLEEFEVGPCICSIHQIEEFC
jgi:hypothetical protein